MFNCFWFCFSHQFDIWTVSHLVTNSLMSEINFVILRGLWAKIKFNSTSDKNLPNMFENMFAKMVLNYYTRETEMHAQIANTQSNVSIINR
jgi:hypothetical protein